MTGENQTGQAPREPQGSSGGAASGRDESRSFDQPGHTGPQGEGGGSMSGRGQESPGEPEASKATPDIEAKPGSGDATGGLATPLQPGGTIPGGGPGATQGSVGTGGAPSGGSPSGSLKRGGA